MTIIDLFLKARVMVQVAFSSLASVLGREKQKLVIMSPFSTAVHGGPCKHDTK